MVRSIKITEIGGIVSELIITTAGGAITAVEFTGNNAFQLNVVYNGSKIDTITVFEGGVQTQIAKYTYAGSTIHIDHTCNGFNGVTDLKFTGNQIDEIVYQIGPPGPVMQTVKLNFRFTPVLSEMKQYFLIAGIWKLGVSTALTDFDNSNNPISDSSLLVVLNGVFGFQTALTHEEVWSSHLRNYRKSQTSINLVNSESVFIHTVSGARLDKRDTDMTKSTDPQRLKTEYSY